jgi:hypothetical protein
MLAARRLGYLLADSGLELVYGGGRVGLMGEVARATLDRNGKVIGVIPESLLGQELAFKGQVDLRVVTSMHERKALMADLADGFIALPGGLGTFEEIMEVTTWAQLGLHQKPCGILNLGGYYQGLIAFIDHAVGEGFVHPGHRALIIVEEDPVELLNKFSRYSAPQVDKAGWVKRVNNSPLK